jgi:nucleoid-associated protein YgaU
MAALTAGPLTLVPRPVAPPARPGHPVTRPRTPAAVYRRRRLAVVAAALALVPVAHAGWGILGGGPLTAPGEPPTVPAATHVYVVQPGDTLWSIAHRLDPAGDERPLVARLAAEAGPGGLRPGQALETP